MLTESQLSQDSRDSMLGKTVQTPQGRAPWERGTRAGRPTTLQYRNGAVKEEEPKDGTRCSLERGVAIRVSPESRSFHNSQPGSELEDAPSP